MKIPVCPKNWEGDIVLANNSGWGSVSLSIFGTCFLKLLVLHNQPRNIDNVSRAHPELQKVNLLGIPYSNRRTIQLQHLDVR